MSPSLDRLFAYLDDLSGRAPLPLLKTALADCSACDRDVLEFIRFSQKTYQRIPLRGTDWYQAWVMCWKNGQRSPIHDHRGSSCALRVLRGTLTETLFCFAANGHIKATSS